MQLKKCLLTAVVVLLPFSIFAFPDSDQNSLGSQTLSVSDRPTASVLEWASDKVKASFSYNWVDYKDVTSQAEGYFTKQGYEHYLKSLKDSGSTESVVNKKLILQVKTSGPAKLLKEGVYQDKYAWQVEVPAVFTYYNVNAVVKAKADIVLLISREPSIDFKDGLAITQLLLKPDK